MEKPHSVVQFLKQLDFSDVHIRSSIQRNPEILFSDVYKTLKPKVQFFEDLGFTGPDLGNFISTHPRALLYSLERTLIPCVDIIKKALVKDKKNQDLIQVLQRSHWGSSASRLKCNIAFLESCELVGSQLSMLLKKQPRLFFISETALRDLLSRVLDMGFSVDSGMFVHAVSTVGGMSAETFSRKFELYRSFGFSEEECMDMFRRALVLLAVSEGKLKLAWFDNCKQLGCVVLNLAGMRQLRSFGFSSEECTDMFRRVTGLLADLAFSDGKLKLGINFLLKDVKLERNALVSYPICLMFSMETRVIPRHRVLRVITPKGLLQKEPSLSYVLTMSEVEFLGKFMPRFLDDAKELLEM
ncbi:hypothetical protein RHMOL_Rhmol10G0230100 [Rhododendron molle]|uniref:Uncharacterized protein n=1 Tax=Rhododendron molle TaxID=49168 RepID=A0ACC0M6B3_RHOML|nr:hypothetical protein RHMOL_Rhmol10G0230100 [Rhododendron molle]